MFTSCITTCLKTKQTVYVYYGWGDRLYVIYDVLFCFEYGCCFVLWMWIGGLSK